VKKILLIFSLTLVLLGLSIGLAVSFKDQKEEDKVLSDNNVKIEQLEQQVKEKEEFLKSLNGELVVEKEKVATLTTSVENYELEIVALTNTINDYEDDIELLNEEKSALENRKSELETEIESKRVLILELESQAEVDSETISQLQENISLLQSDLNILNGDLDLVNSELEEMRLEIDSVKAERDSALSDLVEKTNELNEANANITELESEVATKEVEIASLNAQILNYQNALNRDESKLYIEDFLVAGSFSSIKISSYEYLISSTDSGVKNGLFLFNTIDYSIEKIYDNYYNFASLFRLSESEFLIGRGNHLSRLFLFNSSTKSVIEVSNSYICYASIFYRVSDNKVLICDVAGGNSGVHLYNIDTQTTTRIYTSLNSINGLIVLSNSNAIFSCSNSTGLYLFDNDKDTITQICSSGQNYTFLKQVTDDKYIFSCSNLTLLYSLSDGSFVEVAKKTAVDSFLLSDGTIFVAYNSDIVSKISVDGSIDNFNLNSSNSITSCTRVLTNNDLLFLLPSDKTDVTMGIYYFDCSTLTRTFLNSTTYSGRYFVLSSGNVIYTDFAGYIYLFDCDAKTFNNIGNWKISVDNANFVDCGDYLKIYNDLDNSEVAYYIYSTGELVTEEPV